VHFRTGAARFFALVNMERGSTHPLLRTVMPDGTIYLFVIEADDTWSVRRDDKIIADGPGDSRGIDRGTRLFVSLTRTERGPPLFPDVPGTPAVPRPAYHA